MRRKGRKSAKRRAHTTHGYGRMQKHRGAGNRGGRGMAGTGKRADQKKSLINPATYFGRVGFTTLRKAQSTINVNQLSSHIDEWTKKKYVEKSSKGYTIDLQKARIDKLLGSGKINLAFSIRVKYASQSAVDKIKKAGGSVEILSANNAKSTSKSSSLKSGQESEEA